MSMMINSFVFAAPGGGGIPWTPLDMATVPQIYLDVEDSVVTDVSGFASAISNLGAMGASGDFSQATAGNRPAILAAALNGKQVLSFDGTDDFLSGNSTAQLDLFRNANGAWGFIVYKKRTVDVSATARTLFAATIGTSAGSRFQIKSGDSVGPAANQFGISTRRADADALARLSSPNNTSGSYLMGLAISRYNTSLGELHENGAVVASNASLTSGGSLTSNTASQQPLAIGASSTGGSPNDADIAAIIISNGVISLGDIDKLFGWAAHKYGLTASLPGGHPYKTVAPTV